MSAVLWFGVMAHYKCNELKFLPIMPLPLRLLVDLCLVLSNLGLLLCNGKNQYFPDNENDFALFLTNKA